LTCDRSVSAADVDDSLQVIKGEHTSSHSEEHMLVQSLVPVLSKQSALIRISCGLRDAEYMMFTPQDEQKTLMPEAGPSRV
jgi:hypothetical protein